MASGLYVNEGHERPCVTHAGTMEEKKKETNQNTLASLRDYVFMMVERNISFQFFFMCVCVYVYVYVDKIERDK